MISRQQLVITIAAISILALACFGCATIPSNQNLSTQSPGKIDPEATTTEQGNVTMPEDEKSDSDQADKLTPEDIASQEHLTPPIEPVEVDLGSVTPEPVGTPENIIVPPPGVPNSLVKLVHDVSADLSRYLGIDISEVTYSSTEEVTWPDSSLGCPQPGMGYLQVLTDGFKITLDAQGQEYYYHTKGTSYYVLCIDGQPAQ